MDTMTTTQDFTQLRALAEAASSPMSVMPNVAEHRRAVADLVDACTPATIIALLDAMEALQKQLADHEQQVLAGLVARAGVEATELCDDGDDVYVSLLPVWAQVHFTRYSTLKLYPAETIATLQAKLEALQAEVARLRTSWGTMAQVSTQTADLNDRLAAERDAALARLAEMEAHHKEVLSDLDTRISYAESRKPTLEQFDTWWNGSKYMQVVFSDMNTRQVALDGWNAAAAGASPMEPETNDATFGAILFAFVRLSLMNPSEAQLHQLDRLIAFYGDQKFASQLKLLAHQARTPNVNRNAGRAMPLVFSGSSGIGAQPVKPLAQRNGLRSAEDVIKTSGAKP